MRSSSLLLPRQSTRDFFVHIGVDEPIHRVCALRRSMYPLASLVSQPRSVGAQIDGIVLGDGDASRWD